LPPYVLAKFLTAELGCEVALLGIQPFSNGVDAPLSPGMQQVVGAVVDMLYGALTPLI